MTPGDANMEHPDRDDSKDAAPATLVGLHIRFNSTSGKFAFFKTGEDPTGPEWYSVNLNAYEYLKSQEALGKTLEVHRGQVIAISPKLHSVSLYELKYAILQATKGLVDAKAQSMGYANVEHAISFADEPHDEQFQIEGLAFRRWNSACRRAALQYVERLHQEKAYHRPRTVQIEAELPVFELV
jgi:hypothetical protein